MGAGCATHRCKCLLVTVIDVINVEVKMKKNVKNRKKRGENKKKTFVNVG